MGSSGSKLISLRGILRPPPLRLTAFLACAAISLSAAGTLPVFANTTTPVSDLRQTARDYFVSADYGKAIETYNTLLSQQPSDAFSIKVDLGLCYKAAKDYPHALKLFSEVASSDSTRKAEALFFTEDCYCEMDKIPDAVTVLTTAYNECPDARADVLLRRAARFLGIQKYEQAIADYREFITKFPERTSAISQVQPAIEMARGLSQKATKDYTAAISTFSQIAAKYPAKAFEAELLTEDCLSEQHKHDECAVHLTRMLDKYPEGRAEILMRRATRLGDSGRLQECLTELLSIQNEYPEKFAEAKLGEGLTRLTIGQKTGSPSELRRGLEMLENYKAAQPGEEVFEAAARFHLGMHYVYFGHGVSDEALRNNPATGRDILLAAAAELPESMYTWWMKTEAVGGFLVGLRYSETLAEIDKLLAQNPPATWEEYLLFLKWHSLVGLDRIAEAEEVVFLLAQKYPSSSWTDTAKERMPIYRKQGGKQ